MPHTATLTPAPAAAPYRRSVVVDLFQGQLKTERRCLECGKRSAKFEPFMYFTVPIPAQNEKLLSVLVVYAPPRRSSENGGDTGGEGGGEGGASSAGNAGGNAGISGNGPAMRPAATAVRYAVTLPRLGDVSDLKKAVAKISGIEASQLAFAHVQKGRCARPLHDEAALVRQGAGVKF